MKYRTVLFATDFSEASETARQQAFGLARESQATLLLVHVEDIPLMYPGAEALFVAPDYPNPALREKLDAMAPADGKLRCEVHHLLGAPAEEIVRVADERQVDLIVIGSHGRTGVRRMLLGSVAELVVRRAHCSVLVVKPADQEAGKRAADTAGAQEQPGLPKPQPSTAKGARK